MKRFLTILLTTLALAGALCVSASASSFNGPAAELAAIGMLKGSAGGFQLDEAPTRSQAAIMLVRLYGAEDEAKAAYAAGELKCPFTDVSETAAPYVAWLADKGLASGTGAGTFGASSACTAKAYTIFLLRALGYQDGADFTTATAGEFALKIGLLDTSVFTGRFLRDDLVAMTYQALGTDLKSGDTYLLASLIKSGAIDAAAAKPITAKIENYRALQSAAGAMGQGVDASIDAKMRATVAVSGASEGQNFNMSESQEALVTGAIQAVADQDVRMAMKLTVKMGEETEEMELYIKNGAAYVRSGGEAYQAPIEGMDALRALLEQQPAQNSGAAMLPFIDSVSTRTSGGNTVYDLTLNDAFAGLLSSILRQALQDAEVALGGATIVYTVDKDGSLKAAAVSMNLRMDMSAGEAGTAMTVKVTASMDMGMDIKASGKDVKVVYPDLSGFASIIGGADGPTAIWGSAAA